MIEPQSQSINQGNSVTFGVVATGSGPLAYQWQFNGMNIAGATQDSYTINTVHPADSGFYAVVVTNVAGSAKSSNAALVVNVPPAIVTQPQGASVMQGENITFSVVAVGSTPLSYQWVFNGSNILGATTASYSITNVQPANGGSYSVCVTNMAGSVTSSNANLIVNVDPSSVAGLRLWLRAEAGVVTNSSGKVQQWNDRTTNHYDGTQSTDTRAARADPKRSGV